MNTFKKILCVLLSCLLCASLLVPAFAEDILPDGDEEPAEHQKLVIFVEGIGARDLYDVNTGETLFPPSTNAIVSAVFKALPAIMKAIATQDTDVLEQPLVEAVNDLFLPIACDENGKPADNTAFDWEWYTEEEILNVYESDDPHARVVYCYDWRLSMQDIVKGLHDYIEYVMEVTGVEKVSLVGFSMGTCTVMSYLKMYDYEYVDDVVLLAGAFTGVSSCGEPYSGQVALDSDALVRFVDGMINTDESFMNVLLNTALHALNDIGLLDKVIDLGTLLIDRLKPAVYEQVFAQTFATLPGMWSLIAPEDYDGAKAILGSKLSPEYTEIIDWYHYEVQANNEEIINGCFERGINFGIVTKYGYAVTPVISDINSMSDSVIDTKYESFGATCAPVGETLGEGYTQAVANGHDCIAPDNLIDSSTCRFCDYTWFVKNVAHSNEYRAMMDVCRPIIDADHQITVWDEAPAAAEGEEQEVRYPQFCVFDEATGKVVPLSADNDYCRYTVDPSSENAITIFGNFVKNYISHVKYMIEDLKAQIRGFRNKVENFGSKIFGLGSKIC